MDLNARVDVNFARVDVNFQTVSDLILLQFFLHFDISQHQGPTYTPYKISAKYTKPFWRNGLKCQVRHKFFKGRCKFSNGHCDLIMLQIFFILISINIKVLLMLHTKFQPNIPSCSGENGNFISFAMFSNGILNSRQD